MYMWHCVHIMQVVLCTCDVLHMLRRWFFVQLVLCRYCTYGTPAHGYFVRVVHVLLWVCDTMYVHCVVMVL